MFEFPSQIVRLADFDDDRRRLLGQCLEFLLPLVILCIYAQSAGRRKVIFWTAERDKWPNRTTKVFAKVLFQRQPNFLVALGNSSMKAFGPPAVPLLRTHNE